MRTDNSKVIYDLIEENERLKKSASVTDNSWRELVEENERLKEEVKFLETYKWERDKLVEERAGLKDENSHLKLVVAELEKLIQYLNGKVPAENNPSIHRRGKPVDGSEGEE
jgi:peptidoglycan hydrolase CwlO-like protein